MVQVIDAPGGFGQQLARQLGGGLGAGLNQAIEHSKKMSLERAKHLRGPGHDQVKKSLIAKGVSPEDAELYVMLSTGGQTAFAKDILENSKRGLLGDSPMMNQDFQEEDPRIEQLKNERPLGIADDPDIPMRPPKPSPEKLLQREMAQFVQEQDRGLTPAEKIKRGTERFSKGLPVYQEAGKKLRSLSNTKRNLEMLKGFNKGDSLPKGLGRLNVDAEGNLRLPFMASNEAQRFVKTINEFASGAKDTYGSRVTNFDLAQYLKQFPNLLNSKEGINQLIEQIDVVNDINAVYYKNLKNVFDNVKGVRNIDPDVAESFAEKISEPQIAKMVKRFDQIGTVEKLPAAHKNKGEQFQDEETGDIYVSDGTSWIKKGK